MNTDLLDYARWYFYEEDYFVSVNGNLISSFPRQKPFVDKEYLRVSGFRRYIPGSDKEAIKYYSLGKPIVTVPRDITPIRSWESEG